MTLESTEDRWLEADPDFERSMPVHHDMGRMPTMHGQLYRQKGQEFFPERKTSTVNVLMS